MAEDSHNPYATPKAALEPPRVKSNRPLASPWARLGAYVIDTLIIALPFIVYMIMDAEPISEEEDSWLRTLFVPNFFDAMTTLASGALFFLLNGYLLVTRGQSIGKIALRIQIVDMDGSPTPAGRILGIRTTFFYLVDLIPLLGLLDVLFIFRADHRCWHDMLAGTQVVKNS